jgi:hypothetical protein
MTITLYSYLEFDHGSDGILIINEDVNRAPLIKVYSRLHNKSGKFALYHAYDPYHPY